MLIKCKTHLHVFRNTSIKILKTANISYPLALEKTCLGVRSTFDPHFIVKAHKLL